MLLAIFLHIYLLSDERWSYRSETDQMGRSRTFAQIKSTNAVEFAFPYRGSQHATLTLRKTGRSTDVILEIERGQFQCSLYDCAVNVRFDDHKPWRLGAAEAADARGTTIFLNGWLLGAFIKDLRKASRLRIEATFFREGSRVLEFDVAGLNWK